MCFFCFVAKCDFFENLNHLHTVKTVRIVEQESLSHGEIWQNCSIHITRANTNEQ